MDLKKGMFFTVELIKWLESSDNVSVTDVEFRSFGDFALSCTIHDGPIWDDFVVLAYRCEEEDFAALVTREHWFCRDVWPSVYAAKKGGE